MGKRRVLKSFDAYIDGDGDLRKLIFSEKPANQHVIFDLFCQLDHAYNAFFVYFVAIPSTNFWDMLLAQISAIASGSARNRNFCEDYDLLRPVKERKSDYSLVKDKAIDLVGASHGLWWELADPDYVTKPNAQGLLIAFQELSPNRMSWEWWLEDKARKVKKLWEENKHSLSNGKPSAYAFEHFFEREFGLAYHQNHWYNLTHRLLETYEITTKIKHRIANPYLRLVYTVTKSIAAYNQPGQFFDTFNIACAGLMRAIAKYAPSMAMAFSNFADREVRYEVYYQLSNYNLITLPHKSWQKHREFEDFKKQYFAEYKREASLDDLIFEYELDRNEVYEIYRQVSMQNPHSLDQKTYCDDQSSPNSQATLKDKIEDPKYCEERKLNDDQEVLLLALLRMSLDDRKIFIAANNLCDLVLDIRPDEDELRSFFFGNIPSKITKSNIPFDLT